MIKTIQEVSGAESALIFFWFFLFLQTLSTNIQSNRSISKMVKLFIQLTTYWQENLLQIRPSEYY